MQFPALPSSLVVVYAAAANTFVELLPMDVFAWAAALLWSAHALRTTTRFARCLGIEILTIPHGR